MYEATGIFDGFFVGLSMAHLQIQIREIPIPTPAPSPKLSNPFGTRIVLLFLLLLCCFTLGEVHTSK